MSTPLGAAQQQLQTTLGKRMTGYFAGQTLAAQATGPEYALLISEISKLILRGGKRLRPLLVTLAYSGLGGRKRAAILDAALATELFHAFVLMHDDTIDRDNVRWGGPNLIGHYEQQFASQLSSVDTSHFANAWNILAGDATYSMAQELLLAADFPAEQIVRANRLMQQTLFAVVGGELADVALTVFPDETTTSEARLLSVCYHKTARYTFIMPLQLGALFANAGELDKIEDFGRSAGIAFQLQDDLLGMFGDEKITGKSSLGDLREGKRTLLIAKGLELGDERQRSIIHRYLGSPDANRKHLQLVRMALIDCGARAAVQMMIEDYSGTARQTLGQIGFNQSVQSQLTELIDRLVHRSA